MNNMTVVYADAEEKYVKNVILYGKTAVSASASAATTLYSKEYSAD